MQNITKSAEPIDLRVLARLPYRGIQKQVALELGLTSAAVNRRLRLRDALVLRIVVRKMLEINEKVAKVEEDDRQLSEAFVKAAEVGSNARSLLTNDQLVVEPVATSSAAVSSD